MKTTRRLSAFVFLAFAARLAAEAPPENFVRSTETPEKLSAVQTRIVEYRPANGTGPSILLVGASHLGTPEYYAALQKRLDACSVVLFEGVGLGDALKQGPGTLDRDAGIQKQLANALGLKFQLDAIDYRRANFVNSDLGVEGVQSEIHERADKAPAGKQPGGKKPAGKESAGEESSEKSDDMFQTLMEALQGTGKGAEMVQPLLALLGNSEQSRATMRLVLIEVLGRAGEMLEVAKNASPEMKDLFDVILTERNEIVLRDLRVQVGKLPAGKNVAVFYGAAHLPELAQRIAADLHYAPAAEKWETAFTADPAQSAIQPAQLHLIIEMATAQLKAGGGGGLNQEIQIPGLTAPKSGK
jgi:hypothetical protein